MSEDVFALEATDDTLDLALFAYAFLCTRTGVQAVRSTSYGTKTLKLRRDLLENIPLPVPSRAELSRVGTLVRTAVRHREEYVREMCTARSVVEDLPAMREALEMCSERKARTALWSGPLPTLSAWNYASAGEALPFLLRSWKGRLGDLVPRDGLFRGGRFQRVPSLPPHGIDFLNQRDAFSIRPVPRRVVEPAVPKEWLYAPEFSLLAGGQGTLGEGELFGRIALVTADIATAGITEHLLRIQAVNRAASALLFAYLSTVVGRRLLRSTGVGTKLLSLRPDLAFALPVPDLDALRSKKIVGCLERACAARVAGTNAEREAISFVEEEVLRRWLA